jgi:hypothetical protein
MGSLVGDIVGPVIGGVTSLFGGKQSSNAAQSAANTSADAQVRAAQIAADASRFRPVGVTTGFGTSNFGYDEAGNLSTAGYNLNPQLEALRNRYLAQAGGVNQNPMIAASQPLYGAAGGMFNLAGQLMPTNTDRRISPEAQALAQRYSGVSAALMPSTFQTGASPAAQAYAENLRQTALQLAPKTYDTRQAADTYMTEQEAVLEAGRNQQLAAIRNQLAQSGRGGLAVGGDGNMQAANPELAAYYNSLAQQRLGLAATATDTARNRLFQDVQASTGLQGQALTAEQQAEAISRNNMLQNTALSLGYGTTGYQTQVAGEDVARQRYAQDLGMAQGLYTGGAGLLGQISPLQAGGYAERLAELGLTSTQLGLASSIEGMGQGALDIGTALGARTTSAAQLGAQGLLAAQTNAARTQQAANQYSPFGAALTGFGQQIATSGSPTSGLNSWFSNYITRQENQARPDFVGPIY